jgi:hypothetical protein
MKDDKHASYFGIGLFVIMVMLVALALLGAGSYFFFQAPTDIKGQSPPHAIDQDAG